MKKKGALLASISMVLVAVLALTTASFAWFTGSTTASVTDINMTVTTSDALLISAEADGIFGTSVAAGDLEKIQANVMGTYYTDYADTTTGATMHKLAPATPETITDSKVAPKADGSGLLGFLKSKAIGADGTVWDPAADYYEEAVSNNSDETINYMKFDLYVKSTVKVTEANQKVNLSLDLTTGADSTYAGTSVTPRKYDLTDSTWKPAGNSDPERFITYSLRYGFTATKNADGTTPTAAAVYAPNSADSGLNAAVDSAKAYTPDASSEANGVSAADMLILEDMAFGEVYKVTVYVWIEGNDKDCANDVAASAFMSNLVFKATTVTP